MFDRAALHEELRRVSEPWLPKPGEVLIGTVVDVASRGSTFGGSYPVLTVLAEDGVEYAFHAYHTVAKDELERLAPKPGELIGIAYHGREPGKEYERYRIKVVRDSEPGLAELQAAGEPEREPGVPPEPPAAPEHDPNEIPF